MVYEKNVGHFFDFHVGQKQNTVHHLCDSGEHKVFVRELTEWCVNVHMWDVRSLTMPRVSKESSRY